MVDSAQGLLEIINGVLDFSKLEAGHVRVASETFSLRAIAESVTDLLGSEARRKRLRLVTCVGAGVPGVVHGDPGRVRQILVNLVGNAVKFTDRGDVVVRISRDGANEQGLVVRIDVADTGVGIPSDAQAEVFKPFVQVNGSRARVHAGTGLGLAITRRLVETLGGSISFTSSPGIGTTVSARIPFASVPEKLGSPAPRPLRGWRVGVDLRPGIGADAIVASLGDLGANTVPIRSPDADCAAECDAVVTDEWDGPDQGSALLITRGAHADASQGTVVVLPLRAERLGAAILGQGGKSSAARVGVDREGARRVSPDQSPAPDGRAPLPRVLLVDDNDVNRSLAWRQLESLSVSCYPVASGAEALGALDREAFALVLMDCRMPGMDGFETTRRMRAREARSGRHTPIVAITADGRSEDRQACLDAGMDDHIAKPMTIADLGRALGRWLPTDPAGPATSAERADGDDDHSGVGITTLIEQIGHDETARLYQTWKLETPTRLEEIREGIDRGDCRAIADAAHVLKSTCGLFGAVAAAETAAQAETAARSENIGAASACARTLEGQIAQAMADADALMAVPL